MAKHLVWALYFNFLCSVGNAQDKLSVTKEHLSGVVEAHHAAMDGWRTGDLIIRTSSSGKGQHFRPEDDPGPRGQPKYVEGPDASSLVVEVNSVYRVIFDFDKQRCLVVGNFREERTKFDALENSFAPVVNERFGAYLFNEADMEKDLMGIFPDGTIYRSTAESASDALSVTTAPDVRYVGWSTLMPWSCEPFRDNLERVAEVDGIQDISNVGKDIYQFTRPTFSEGVVTKYHWDVKRNLPVKFWEGRVSDGFARHEGSAQWKSVDGINVPTSTRYKLSNIDHRESRYYLLFNEVPVDIHWFAVNADLTDELFKKEIMRDRKKLDELLSQDVFEKSAEEKSDGDRRDNNGLHLR